MALPALALFWLVTALPCFAGESPAMAPRFLLEKPGGGFIGSPDLAGKVAIVNFWATWCAPCLQEIPYLNEAHKKYLREGLVVIGINYQQDGERVARFLGKTPVAYPIALDKDGAVAKKFGVNALPSSALIGKDGAVIHKLVGALTPSVIEEWIKEALAK
jgi:thiol-disulfide isomerase/thioredoxin